MKCVFAIPVIGFKPMPLAVSMKLEIPIEVINATTHCPKKFACLSQPVETICQVTYAPDGKIHFVRCTTTAPCAYRQTHSEWHICTCPTRIAINNRYGI